MQTLHTVLLVALPASGKSEVRKYLAGLSPETCRSDFHMGQTQQLDDYPYVHLMRRIDDELVACGQKRHFFRSPDRPFADPRHWGTLIELLNEDYVDLMAQKLTKTEGAPGMWLLHRIDRAAIASGSRGISSYPSQVQVRIAKAIDREVEELVHERDKMFSQDRSGKTIVIEFARGGPQHSPMPLAAPFGYEYSLSKLSPAILENASILYIWVTPEESRRKNTDRTDPNDPGSILHHGVPMEVMLNDYGCDDIEWLETHSAKPGTIQVKRNSAEYFLPIAKFDNRVDKTSFLRKDRAQWKATEIEAVHSGLKKAFEHLLKDFQGSANSAS